MNIERRFREKERLQWQCRRGMLELDCLFQRFLDERYDQAPAQIQHGFRQLLRETDPQLFHWLIAAPQDAPQKYRALLEMIRASGGAETGDEVTASP
ncbi:FAD assembly factor SdhE [Thiolapillus sp.]